MKRTSSKETNEQKIRRFFNKKKIIQFDADNEPDEFFFGPEYTDSDDADFMFCQTLLSAD